MKENKCAIWYEMALIYILFEVNSFDFKILYSVLQMGKKQEKFEKSTEKSVRLNMKVPFI